MLFHNIATYQNIISGIIAPHGMTDLFHARQNNYVKQLLSINIACASSSLMLNTIQDPYFILDTSFLISSVIHFRHDMPQVFPKSEYSTSLFLVFISLFYNHDIFFVYMLFFHVPHHYYMNRNVIKENINMNVGILILTTMTSLFGNHMINAFDSSLIFDLSKGVIISHILYEELYIHKNNSNMSLVPM